MDFELCIDSVEEAIIAKQFGFKRVELCSGLEVGGLTPSYGLISSCTAINGAEVHVMVRPNAGRFVYSNVAFEVMQKDVLGAAAGGARGVVFGVLTTNNRVDFQKNSTLIQLAKSQKLECTFHRAFDLSADWIKDLDDLIEMGFDRILSSGGASKAIDGIERLTHMREYAGGRIQIMAGSGVNEDNALKLAKAKVDALHFTARKASNLTDKFGFGTDIQIDKTKIEEILKHF